LEADEARRAQELSDLEEELESLRGQVKLNLDRISTLIQELPLRIISIERLQILSLTLQNHALNVQRRERDLQAATVRRVLLRTNESVVEPSALLVKALSKVEMLLPGKVSPAERVVREVIVQEVLEACSRLYGGGEELLKLAQGTGKQRWEASSADDAWAAPTRDMLRGKPSGTHVPTARSPHLSLAAVVPTLMEVRDEEEMVAAVMEVPDPATEPRASSPSLRPRHKSVGELAREAAAFSTRRGTEPNQSLDKEDDAASNDASVGAAWPPAARPSVHPRRPPAAAAGLLNPYAIPSEEELPRAADPFGPPRLFSSFANASLAASSYASVIASALPSSTASAMPSQLPSPGRESPFALLAAAPSSETHIEQHVSTDARERPAVPPSITALPLEEVHRANEGHRSKLKVTPPKGISDAFFSQHAAFVAQHTVYTAPSPHATLGQFGQRGGAAVARARSANSAPNSAPPSTRACASASSSSPAAESIANPPATALIVPVDEGQNSKRKGKVPSHRRTASDGGETKTKKTKKKSPPSSPKESKQRA
jgi:hypothetical protein